jgi:chromate reductase, NAD(P)H dehydrogenase (quinone)
MTTGGHQRRGLRFLVFSGSLREQSLNSRLARYAGEMIRRHGGQVDLATMADFDGPSFDQDLQDGPGIPPGPTELHRRLQACDGFLVCSPEYNASMPGGLKNAIDWASRFRPQSFNGRHCLLMSASPSMVGGNRGLWALRVPLEHLGARVYPDMFSLANAHQALTVTGELASDELRTRFEQTIESFMDLVEAAKLYPCAKKLWVEFLGEQPDPVIDRVEIAT